MIETGAHTNLYMLAGENRVPALRQIVPPGFLTQAFAVDWSAGCTS